jgi:G:T/U-mismatch repair DNA glycosylase
MEKSNLVPFIRHDLDILFAGLNPAKGSSDNRHYFSVNQAFWNQLYDAGLIKKEVDQLEADEIVFGSNDINFCGWSFGITDLITEVAESNSRVIEPSERDCQRLEREIRKYKPKTVILLHGKVTKTFLAYLGIKPIRANHGQIGQIIKNCPTLFYSIAFPHRNNIPSIKKVEKYKVVKNFLLNDA